MVRVAVIVVPRPDRERPVLEYAWSPVRALDGLVTVVPIVVVPRVSAWTEPVRKRLGRRLWPPELAAVLHRLRPAPRLVPYFPTPGRSLQVAARQVASALASDPPDVLMGSLLDEAGYVATAVGARLSRPAIPVAHGSDVDRWRRRPRSPSAGRSSQALRRAAAVIAVSRALAEPLRSVGLDVEVVPFTVFARDFPSSPELPDGPTKLLFVGRLGPMKGFDVALRMLEALPEARLTAVGPVEPGYVVPDFSRLAWLGPRPHSDLAGLYAQHHLLVHPSRAEGLGNVLVESLLIGRPVVARPVGGIPEVVQPRVGALVQGDDAQSWAQAVQAVRGRQERGDLTPAALRRSVEPFTWEVAGPRLAQVLQRAAGR